MLRVFTFALVTAFSLFPAVSASEAQTIPQWDPPSREMPQMPRMADLQGDWLSSVQPWFRGVEQVTGAPLARMRALGEARAGEERAQVVRFNSGPLPIAVWSDRNGDGRLDMIELYRGGSMIIQVIDANFDGRANVMRIYEAGGSLLREERLNR